MSRTIKGSKKSEKNVMSGKRGRGFPWEHLHDAFTKKSISKTERRRAREADKKAVGEE